MKVLIIIPAYNEEENIEKVVENLKLNYKMFDYIVVNDGSKDRTAEICKDRGYNLIDLPINLGLAAAFQTGVKYAYRHHYDCAIQFDADGQHRAEYIEKLVAKIEEGYDIAIGSRFVEKKKEKSLRMIGSRVISGVIKITTGFRLNDPTSGMRMLNQRMIKEFALNLNYGPEPDTISYLYKKGCKITEVQVEMDERTAGESYLNLKRSIIYMMRMTMSILFVQSFRKK